MVTKADVDAEAAAREQQVANYDAATLDADLARLETLSAFVATVATWTAASEALSGVTEQSVKVRSLQSVAEGLGRVPSIVRSYVQQAKDAVAGES